MEDASLTKSAKARLLGIARSTLYYAKKRAGRDWMLKVKIEEVLREHPSYGSPRIALVLGRNHKAIERVMKLFGIKAYRRRGKKWLKKKKIQVIYANLLFAVTPSYRHHAWAADFTELWWKKKKLYVATVIDLYTREIVGMSISKSKGLALTMAALQDALFSHTRPVIFHSDNGSEYRAHSFVRTLETVGSAISRSYPACPWENGYQESFYDKFKVELGDPNRFASYGELIAETYRQIRYYNNDRIHTALKMPPRQFAQLHAAATMQTTV
ncbi:IS3 family transposase [Bradyrhizobium manausense]|nr:IS3 family transposase [Bradyrhizobium manausense]